LPSIDTCYNDLIAKNSGNLPGIYRSQINASIPIVKIVIDKVYNYIVATLHSAAAACIPNLTPKTLKPWWSAELKLLKKQHKLHS